MNLLTKYNRVNIPIIITTLLISSIAFYFIIHFVLVHQLDKDLRIEQQEILHYIKEKGALPESSDYKDQQIEFQPVTTDHFKTRLSTEMGFDKNEDEAESFRKVEFLISIGTSHYIAKVRKSQQETEDIVKMILMITFALIVFVLLVIFVANRLILAKLWKPFNHTLSQLKGFQLSSKTAIIPVPTDINEFRELNETAIFMVQKASRDYESLKNFSENASHEIQTPLAIIRNKIELLSQSETLNQNQIGLISGLNDAVSKLSRLNQSLLLLTKIENRQFEDTGSVNFSDALNRNLANFEELAGIKKIRIDRNIEASIYILMNESLAEILISNLVVNAIRHNYINGEIWVDLNSEGFSVCNSGTAPHEPTAVLFERFRKDSQSGDSTGLGLAIVKTICETYGFGISYEYHQGKHMVRVTFSKGNNH